MIEVKFYNAQGESLVKFFQYMSYSFSALNKDIIYNGPTSSPFPNDTPITTYRIFAGSVMFDVEGDKFEFTKHAISGITYLSGGNVRKITATLLPFGQTIFVADNMNLSGEDIYAHSTLSSIGGAFDKFFLSLNYEFFLGNDSDDFSPYIELPSGTPTLLTGNNIMHLAGGTDFIIAGSGNETLHGGNGGDTLYGMGGSDHLYGDNGHDMLSGGDGADFIRGGEGNDTLLAGLPSDTAYGPDTIHGDAGNDYIVFHRHGGLGFGGDGNDVISGDHVAGPLGPGSMGDALFGEAGNDTLNGGLGDDHLDGGEGDDQLTGAEGNDTLLGGPGDDLMSGGEGNDRFVFSLPLDMTPADTPDFDTVWGGEGQDTAEFEGARAAYAINKLSSTQVEVALIATGDRVSLDSVERLAFADVELRTSDLGIGGPGVRIDGNYWDELLTGTPGADTINGRGGNDTLEGLEGNDLLKGGAGDDVLRGGPGADTLDGGNGFDSADYGIALGPVTVDLAKPAVNTGDAAGDVLKGIEAVSGGDFADVIRGNGANNRLSGGDGNDTLVGRGGHDAIYGGNGADRLEGNAGNDALIGDGGADTLIGHGGDDMLIGFDGADVLKGGAGRDHLLGFKGADELWGGAGRDRFTFQAGDGKDTIMDFQKIDRLEFAKDLLGGQSTGLGVVSAFAKLKGGDVIFQFGNGDSVTLAGVSTLVGLHQNIDIL